MTQEKRGDQRIIPINVDTNVSSAEIDRMRASSDAMLAASGYAPGVKQSEDLILLHSSFMTLQGEGPHAGRQAFFIRFGGCNIGEKDDCRWCDTAFQVGNSKMAMIDSLVADTMQAYGVADDHLYPMRDRFPLYRKRLVVITGGEPLIQLPQLERLARKLHDAGFEIQIETNGYYLRKASDELAACCVVSPKASTTQQGYAKLYDAESLSRARAVKFLLSSDPNSLYHTIPDWWKDVRTDVYVSPIAEYLRAPTRDEGEVSSLWDTSMVDIATTQANYAYAAKYVADRCKESRKELRVSLQQHLLYQLP